MQGIGKGNKNIKYFFPKMKNQSAENYFFKTYKQVPEVYEWRDVVSCF